MTWCVKAETGGKGGGLHSRIHVWLYNEAIWWHKSVVSEVFEQALIFSSYICKVPENILMTFNHKRLFVCALPIVIPRVGFLSFCCIFGLFSCVGGRPGRWEITAEARVYRLSLRWTKRKKLPMIFAFGALVLGLGSRDESLTSRVQLPHLEWFPQCLEYSLLVG